MISTFQEGRFMRYILFFLVVLAASGAQADPAGPNQRDDVEPRILGPLISTGVDLKDERQLIAAMKSQDLSISCGAAYALHKLPLTPLSKRALLQAVDGSEPILAQHAAQSLHRLGDDSWTTSILGRIGGEEASIALSMAGLLAEAGNYQGWYLVEKHLANGDIMLGRALETAPSFAKMSETLPGSVDVLAILKRIAPELAPEYRQIAEFAVQSTERQYRQIEGEKK
jgi:hypothetical protein